KPLHVHSTGVVCRPAAGRCLRKSVQVWAMAATGVPRMISDADASCRNANAWSRSLLASKPGGRGITCRYRGLRCCWLMCRAVSGSRAQTMVWALLQAACASAVPQLPAPRTSTRNDDGEGSGVMGVYYLLTGCAGRHVNARTAVRRAVAA